MSALTTAYAGHGDTTPENVAAVLDQFLPPDLGMVYIPERVPRLQAGLKKVIAWLEGEVGKAGTIPVPDLLASLASRREETGDDVTLVMLFDPENEDDAALAKAAVEAGVKVVDLCGAGDDLLLDDAVVTFEEEAVEEPEPEPEAPAAEEETTPPWTAPDDEKPASPVSEAIGNAMAAAEAALAAHHPVTAPGQGLVFQVALNIPPEGIDALARAIVAAMGHQAAAAISPIAEEAAPAGASNVSHIRGATGEDAPKGTKPYYYDSGRDSYRPARGMARKTEQKVHLSDDEVADVKAKGLLA